MPAWQIYGNKKGSGIFSKAFCLIFCSAYFLAGAGGKTGALAGAAVGFDAFSIWF